ncbi:MAG: CpaF family protein, partial [Tabrizicola sp.]|nr:CpaF family protein [Tabrizicola sp.]
MQVFSRFKKDTPPGRPTPGGTAPATAPVDKAAAFAPRAPQPATQQRAAAEAVAADKEKKRKERLTELKVEIHKRLLEDLNLSAIESATEQNLRSEIASLTTEALDDMSVALNKEDRLALTQELYDEVMGLGPLEPLLKDETINDILVNGPKRIFVERAGRLELSDVTFRDERHLLRIIDKIVSAVGRRVDESNPYCDARLQDGSRFNCMIPPIAVDGSLVSIRKFKKDKLRIEDLVRFGAFTE